MRTQTIPTIATELTISGGIRSGLSMAGLFAFSLVSKSIRRPNIGLGGECVDFAQGFPMIN
jgi:hypothetical protein